MPRHRITTAAEFAAPAGYVYSILADYHHGHPRTLPRRWFRDFRVERGGFGTGTVIRFTMPALGMARHIRASVSEPEPGRVLLERDLASGALTTFTVEPTVRGGSTVTISTDLTVRPGLAGRVERALTRVFLHRIFREQLARLGAILAAPARDDGWSLPLRTAQVAAVAAGAARAN